ncbi:[FeFe] hydrogenase H-cluster maturation GTPase HydF [Treponema sp. J25]|uniref:[FeFe] hydrogenase H-cluster maturation GTPase HydF n=1 Tax=Treponema sp. J25 TaxID=2094121 RepID=UPI00104354DB|nr:[FeFe] hydrogenase H-cluster maturation GTPase HydF [Treponema sp. J25]TCW62293.1 [FeFe] hydrogenase H-cluster maturation GTPase HydF [Treponema sp. J25]
MVQFEISSDIAESPSFESPVSLSLHIVVVGIRNAGKSSLINQLFEKEVSLVSSVPGTTTDPVLRKMELPGLGPVAFVDTAGIDDEGDLGKQRVARTRQRLATAHGALFVTPAHLPPRPEEGELYEELEKGGKPFLVVVTHSDLPLHEEKGRWLEIAKARGHRPIFISNQKKEGAAAVRKALSALSERLCHEPGVLEGLVQEGDHLLLVVPIDLAAPKGRLIQPQVETIRDALDRDCTVTVVKERELYDTYHSLPRPPRLVITDSQVFSKVAADIGEDQALTSFSILFARKKGELSLFLEGLDCLKNFSRRGRVFVMEACSHHRTADDIASVKIPRLFSALVNPRTPFYTVRQIPDDVGPEDLVIHCGGCMITARTMQERIRKLRERGVPVTNYGLFLAWANGLIPRAIACLPEYGEARRGGSA